MPTMPTAPKIFSTTIPASCIFHPSRRPHPLPAGRGTSRSGEDPAAYGQTVNIPLPPGTGDEGLLYVMEKAVMPILADWEPDIIINAAGQDNHFTDPLTHMNVSARGYARLTDMLGPDIVVLEGGYSIEGGLPYVNVGILLALAGLDYSHVERARSPADPAPSGNGPDREDNGNGHARLGDERSGRSEPTPLARGNTSRDTGLSIMIPTTYWRSSGNSSAFAPIARDGA